MKGLRRFTPEYLEQHGIAGSKAIGTRLSGDSNSLFSWCHAQCRIIKAPKTARER